jgi:hypothetical protein
MGSPINDCHKKLVAAQRTIERMTAKRLETIMTLEEENKALRKIAARMDTRLDMQMDFFDYAVQTAGSMGELRKWWSSFLSESQAIDVEAEGWEEQAEALHKKHGLEWDSKTTQELRFENVAKWCGFETVNGVLINADHR